MTDEKTCVENTRVFSRGASAVNASGAELSEGSGRTFYYKLGLLYFFNIVDWICTEALLLSGKFYEANPVMRPVLESFWLTLLVKGVLPLVLIGGCAFVYKISRIGYSRAAEVLLSFGVAVYALVNLWHIFNFAALFFGF